MYSSIEVRVLVSGSSPTQFSSCGENGTMETDKDSKKELHFKHLKQVMNLIGRALIGGNDTKTTGCTKAEWQQTTHHITNRKNITKSNWFIMAYNV